MSTRCATIVYQNTQYGNGKSETEELFRFYRHWDGYPEGHGKDIAAAILAAEHHYEGKLNNRNWCQKLFAFLFSRDADMEVETAEDEHGDLDYLYVIMGDYAAYGGKMPVDKLPVAMAVFRMHWDESYDTALKGESLFKGTATEYLDWLEEREG